MQVIINKHYSCNSMPKPGSEVECFGIQEAFGEKFYLCLHNGIFLSVKEKDVKEVQSISYSESKNGQLIFDF